MDRLALARSGRDTIGAWATYAQGLRLLSAPHERGWIAFLAQPRGVDALVEFSGLPEGRVRNVLGALTRTESSRRPAIASSWRRPSPS